jgi:glutamine synthetase adenylyltransferase
MSERLDAVLNGAKDTVREAEVMAMKPDEAVAAMAALLADGASHLATAFERLGSDQRGKIAVSATEAADAAVKSQRRLERVYREAASALLAVDDLREVMGRRELYRRLSRVSETLVEAADRVWYATVKEG